MTPSAYVLVGAGGTGSLLMQPLLRYLETYHRNTESDFRLAVIDGDNIELHNLDRQMFEGYQNNENKATALIALYGDDNCRAIPEFLGDDNIADRIFDGDTVIICADNYDVRARIERHVLTLANINVINGGNESTDGSLQVFIRRDGLNVTPPLSWMHDEILKPSPHDPSKMSCEERSHIPGGEQTIIANMMSAAQILNAVRLLHQGHFTTIDPNLFPGLPDLNWHELQFDLDTGNTRSSNWRTDGWETYVPEAIA